MLKWYHRLPWPWVWKEGSKWGSGMFALATGKRISAEKKHKAGVICLIHGQGSGPSQTCIQVCSLRVLRCVCLPPCLHFGLDFLLLSLLEFLKSLVLAVETRYPTHVSRRSSFIKLQLSMLRWYFGVTTFAPIAIVTIQTYINQCKHH